MLEEYITSHIAEGRLIPLLEDWSRPYAGYHLFYPSRHQMPAKLKAFAEFLRDATRKRPAPLRLVTPAMSGAKARTAIAVSA
jgi:DNA-binding transcriptional LysR family regulator